MTLLALIKERRDIINDIREAWPHGTDTEIAVLDQQLADNFRELRSRFRLAVDLIRADDIAYRYANGWPTYRSTTASTTTI